MVTANRLADGECRVQIRHPEIFAALFFSAANFEPPVFEELLSSGSTFVLYAGPSAEKCVKYLSV